MMRRTALVLLGALAVAGAAWWFESTSGHAVLPGTLPTAREAPDAGLDVDDLRGAQHPLLRLRGPSRSTVVAAGETRLPADAQRDEPGWKALQQRADEGDVRSACRLSLKLTACRKAQAERGRIDSIVAELASGPDADRQDRIAMLAADEEQVSQLEQRCGGAPEALVQRDWKYLLDAARRGHGPSMWRFVLDPPIDHMQPLAYVDALVAYREHSLGFVDALIERGSAEGLVMALLLSAGIPIIGEGPLYPRDAEATLRAAAAVAEVRGEPRVLRSAIESTRDQIDPVVAQRLVDEGRRMAADFAFQFSTIGNGIEVDETPASCDAHWGH